MPTLPARAGILTLSGTKLMYDAPSRKCVTFSYCSGWGRANKLLYARIPSGHSIVFFKEEGCARDPVFTGDVGKAFGNELVEGDSAIVRSFLRANARSWRTLQLTPTTRKRRIRRVEVVSTTGTCRSLGLAHSQVATSRLATSRLATVEGEARRRC
ncbi:hypothetical protein PHYPSEUDO_012032 [Phytophthora pseudosyringae]|uniref:Uncharacterized protein n=1 Tax=Phytophthora pseudosyringae TaxID=221518 RepID=A0A8T1VAT5_9STRA|nr:hypothetical protein PHYPSEUDO_012032 [Phytophthora pseudosyringae]